MRKKCPASLVAGSAPSEGTAEDDGVLVQSETQILKSAQITKPPNPYSPVGQAAFDGLNYLSIVADFN